MAAQYHISMEPRHLIPGDDYYAIIDEGDHTVAVVETERLAEKVSDILAGKSVDRDGDYASLAWTADDLGTLFKVTDEQAEKFFGQWGDRIRFRLVELGWGVIAHFGVVAGLPLLEEETD